MSIAVAQRDKAVHCFGITQNPGLDIKNSLRNVHGCIVGDDDDVVEIQTRLAVATLSHW